MSSKIKVIYVISHVHKSLAFEWTAVRLKDKYDLTFILLNERPSSLEKFLIENEIRTIRIKYRNKGDLPKALIRLVWFFIKERPAVIHAHLFDASLIALIAGKLTGIRRRMYTRHNSTFHHLYFPSAVKYDRLCNYLSTHIVSISQATDETLLKLEHVPVDKVRKIYHGFDLNNFSRVDETRRLAIKAKWKIPDKYPRFGLVARHIEWKGIQYIIPAFKQFLEIHSEACLIMANAYGPYHESIMELLEGLPGDSVILIPFEEDIAALYTWFDVYVHTPTDPLCEAFGQTYVEALAMGIPSIFTLSGIASEFIKDRENAWVVDFKNSEAIEKGMEKLCIDSELRKTIIDNGKQIVFSQFGIDMMMAKLQLLYNE